MLFWLKKIVAPTAKVRQAAVAYLNAEDANSCLITPFCFTIDTQTLSDQTITVRHRDTLQQQRIAIAQVPQFLNDQIGN